MQYLDSDPGLLDADIDGFVEDKGLRVAWVFSRQAQTGKMILCRRNPGDWPISARQRGPANPHCPVHSVGRVLAADEVKDSCLPSDCCYRIGNHHRWSPVPLWSWSQDCCQRLVFLSTTRSTSSSFLSLFLIEVLKRHIQQVSVRDLGPSLLSLSSPAPIPSTDWEKSENWR